MKNRLIPLYVLSVLVMLTSSCGVNTALQINQNTMMTNVMLNSDNFKVIERVSGSASQDYVLFIGGMNKTSLYAKARADMMQKTNFAGTSRALVNMIAEEHFGGILPFYWKRTVIYTADIIEFNK